MARRCAITEKGVLSGNNVSHSNRKSKRRFLPNMQQVSLQSDALGQSIRMRITASTLRSIDHNGGLDNYLMTTHSKSLSEEARTLKKRIIKAREAAPKPSAV
ncbi:MAG: 50S ribosomal protein L28 [Alphaproteobacteria bacterium]|nr:50S ribosomal protein L28 [Alphaproteobacteria bacterium]